MNINKINELCSKRGITLLQLSKKIGMSNSFYTTLKTGSLKVETLEKIAEVLEVPITVFFDSSSSEDIELIKKELELSKQYYTALEKNYESLKEINELIKTNADSATREAAAHYNIICMLYVDVENLFFEANSYIEESIYKDHPEIEDNKDSSTLDKYKTEDRLYKKFLTVLHKIRPMIKGEMTLTVTSIKEIK